METSTRRKLLSELSLEKEPEDDDGEEEEQFSLVNDSLEETLFLESEEEGDTEPERTLLSQLVQDEKEVEQLVTLQEDDPSLDGRFFFHLRKAGGKVSDIQKRYPDYTWVLVHGIHFSFSVHGKSDGVYLPWLLSCISSNLSTKTATAVMDVVPNPANRSYVLLLVSSHSSAEELIHSLNTESSYFFGKVALWDDFLLSSNLAEHDNITVAGLGRLVKFREKTHRHFLSDDKDRTERRRLFAAGRSAVKLLQWCHYFHKANVDEVSGAKADILPFRDEMPFPDICKDSIFFLGVPAGMAEGALLCLFCKAMATIVGGKLPLKERQFDPSSVIAVVFHSALNHAVMIFADGTNVNALRKHFNNYTSTFQVVVAVPYYSMHRYRDPFPKRKPRSAKKIDEYLRAKDRFELGFDLDDGSLSSISTACSASRATGH